MYHISHTPHTTYHMRTVPSSGIYLIFIYTRLLDPCARGTQIRSTYLMSPWRVRTIQKWYLLTRSLHLCECQIWFGYWDLNRTELYGFYNLLAHPSSSYLTIIISSKASKTRHIFKRQGLKPQACAIDIYAAQLFGLVSLSGRLSLLDQML